MMSAGTDTEDAVKFLAEDSGNVDGSGNFSVSVLGEALRRCHGIELEDSRGHPERLGEDRIGYEEGLVCNLLSHWFALRRMEDGAWWNLNSLLKKPEKISDFYLVGSTSHRILLTLLFLSLSHSVSHFVVEFSSPIACSHFLVMISYLSHRELT